MQSYPNYDINEIMKIEGNNKCMDCQAENPTFASVNNAIFLCENCANIHRNLGSNISLVKSLNEQFSPEQIALLRIGGNARFYYLMQGYGIRDDQNKEFKYHLKFAEYYRLLLLAEINKEKYPEDYQRMINNKPIPEIGLQLMETVTEESIKQANEKNQNEIVKDVSSVASKIGSFFSSIGQAVKEGADKYGITQKIDEAKQSISQGVKNFGESHPDIQNAASKTAQVLTAAKNVGVETFNKIAESETVKNIKGAVNEKYNEVMNSETVTNLSKKAEEQYINLKTKAGFKTSDNNAPQA